MTRPLDAILQAVADGSTACADALPEVQEHIAAAVASAADRDDLAKHALRGLLAGKWDSNMRTLAAKAYEAADAMLPLRRA